MRGFLAGSLALVVLYVAVQPGTASKAGTASNVFVASLRRALSPQVAGVPSRGQAAPQPAPPSGGGGGRSSYTGTNSPLPNITPV